MSLEAEVMPLIDQANIAWGFHAGDPQTMRRTVALACRHSAQIGNSEIRAPTAWAFACSGRRCAWRGAR